MAMHLADITGMSIDISAYGGMAWACINMHCGPRALALRSATPPESARSEEHTSELQSLMRISYAVFCLKKKNQPIIYQLYSSFISYYYYQHTFEYNQ